ncbi:biotin carboxylase N-terminal domain-containing protein [Aeromonas sp. FDAARGOS 1415]|uniref:acetyl/propionyl/methylcrotonyl-CoA carboxylase subunit alpha n=1 Tax=Aeromonas TaxID=642 RepID=UPI001C223501|nr:biotin carboxylase N-terminal domain-containing protein [Aeromonas sp. FDAARGOS 1415]QXB54017.1 ATP-grasp domain-containing protein [Aeromonas sp. FDAARGOS 1415]
MTHQAPIQRLLIANRGEIAVRIIKTARRLGIHTIALYSDADAHAMHVREADEAWHLGPAPARESYLDTAKVLRIAKEARADAVHPGYGFLSENSDFATACEQRGLRFVGPSGAAILAMGDKSGAKALMEAAGVPVLPGYHGADQGLAVLRDQARLTGFPLLIKAASGGGGKGMRRVEQIEDFDEALAAVKREALAAFGDDQVLLERYLPRARHVEVQVFADTQGNAIYLGDRDCSLQRRHQKVIEEAPAPNIAPALRRAMGEAAVAAARAIKYRGAGTVEFLLCGEEFFFMEMNTRLQVEHPVTEAVTGQDLVAWQLAVAEGRPLPLTQEEVVLRGHAVEARLYAEDVAAGFLPASGPIHWLDWPQGVRIDTGVAAGDEVSPYYDPMIAKLVAHGDDRAQAFARLADSLAVLDLGPLAHNGPLLLRLCQDPEVLAMSHHTQWPIPTTAEPVPPLAWSLATLWLASRIGPSPWQQAPGFRLGATRSLTAAVRIGDEVRVLTLNERAGTLLWQGEAQAYELGAHHIRLQQAGRWQRYPLYTLAEGDYVLQLAGQRIRFSADDQRHQHHHDQGADATKGAIAPMHGMVVALLVEAGQPVTRGQPLLVMEAMKMEHILRADRDGVIAALPCRQGDQVSQGTLLVHFAADDEKDEKDEQEQGDAP